MDTRRDTDLAIVPPVVPLEDPRAAVGDIGGAKAANIARTATAGLPTLPGFVLTTAGVARGLDDPAVQAELRTHWETIGGDREVPLVVRSSSTIEDAGESSMAGRFTSVLDVIGWDAFLDACTTVIASGDAVRDTDGESRPLAVLVQVQLDTELGGVMFGVDPVTGATDHVVVEAVAARPDALVSGIAVADHYVLSHRGRIVHHQSAAAPVPLSATLRRRLVRLAAQAGRVFGTPQDVEWAVDRAGALWLLQSRPVTAVAERVGRHAVTLGPGPVAETFPDPLSPLEDDLWIAPLREGLVRALTATGAVSARQLARSPVATTIGGRAAVDLGLLGHVSGHTAFRDRISPSAIGRRLVAAWRVGRLRVALPSLAATVVATVDRDLAAIAPLDTLDTRRLVDLLESSRHELATVHAYEVLAGMLLYRREAHAPAAPLVALDVLGSMRGRYDDATIIAEQPIVLCLVPPSLTRTMRLPEVTPTDGAILDDPVGRLGHRDALRLRARWLHELQTRIVRELAHRPELRRPEMSDALRLHQLRLRELVAVAMGGPLPDDLTSRRSEPGPPLPAAFRVTVAGRLAALEPRHRRHGGPPIGLAAGGGRGSGTVTHRPAPIAPGAVLVTEHLSPSLAAVLPQLGGLIAETGSALSHLAILAREAGVPTVVGVEDARHRFAPGTTVLVDGDAGTIEVLAPATDTSSAASALVTADHGAAS